MPFFKFAWSYRLFNYVAIMLGAMPFASERDTPEAECHVLRTTKLFESAGQNFNRGQRAFFFALGYLGWFAGPWVLFASTTAVVIVMWRRQFASTAQRALMLKSPAQWQTRLRRRKKVRTPAREPIRQQPEPFVGGCVGAA